MTKNKEERMKYKIGVMGKAGRSKGISENLAKAAEIVGREIAKRGCILVNGACMGVADQAAKGASAQGGLVLAYSPAKNLREHVEPPISYPYPEKNVELIFTGLGKIGRNVLSIYQSDGVIFIGGGIGTLNEFSIAYHEGKVLGVLEGTGGMTGEFERLIGEVKKDTGAILVKDRDPKKLVEKVIAEIKKREIEPRKEIPITFRNERGKQLIGIFHLPKREKPPLVIICHGFDGTKTDKKYIRVARALQKEGIAVFRFDFEGCGDSEGNFEEMTIEKEVSDLNSALKAILKEGDLDSKRIALIGGSLGSVVSVLFLKNFKAPIKALVFWSQAFNQRDLFEVWHKKEEIRKWQREGFLIKGDKKIGLEYLKENIEKDYSSLLAEISDVPILLVQGEKDEDVPLEFSERLAKKYKNIELKVLAGADHQFKDPLIREKLVKITVEWLKKYL
jgi:uncharacterized protein (TIGR00725 family)